MIRTRTALLLLTATLAASACHRTPTAAELERKQLRDWKQDLAENQERLAGEDASRGAVSSLWTGVGETFGRLWGMVTGDTPKKAALMMESRDSADERREGLYDLNDYRFGRREPYTKRYSQIAERDEDYTVRAAAVRALNRDRAKEYTALYIKLLEDPTELVRLEAAKALANMPDEKLAVAPLLKHLANPDEARDVRIAAADALRNFRRLDVAQGLVRVLTDRDFGVSWQARKSLFFMTGQDFRYDQSAWLSYLTSKPL